jgi:phage-related protein (TIGR01555 family)
MSTRKSKPAAVAAPVRTVDSFQNFSARVGLGAGSQMDAGRYGLNPITRDRLQLEAAYRDNWVAGQVIDTVADDMTRAGIEFHTGLAPDQTEKLSKAFDRLQLWTKLRDTIAWSRLYGGAIAVFLIDGHRLDTPLDISKVAPKQFKGLVALDRWQLDTSFGVNDLVSEMGPYLGTPKFYKVQSNADALTNQRIHYSRVIRMDGVKMPYNQRITENGWSCSVLERLWDRLVAFDSTTMGTCQLVFKAHLRTYKVDGLRDIIANGGKAYDGLIEQMKMVRTFQSAEGLTVMDAKDTFEAHSYTFAGLDNVLLQIGQQLSGATQIPLVRLFGQSPAGLNSSGESDLRTYYDGISQRQNATLRDGMSRLVALLSRSVLGIDWPEDSDFEFRSLWQLNDEQKSTIAKTIAEAVSAAESSGLISQQTALKELRQSSRTTGIFTNITDEDIEAADSEPPEPILPVMPGEPGVGVKAE